MARQPETVEGYKRSIVDEITYWAEGVIEDIDRKAFKDATDDIGNDTERDTSDPQVIFDIVPEDDMMFFDIFFQAYQVLYDHYYAYYSE